MQVLNRLPMIDQIILIRDVVELLTQIYGVSNGWLL